MDSFETLAKQYKPMIHRIIHQLHIYKEHDLYFNIGLEALWEAKTKYSPGGDCRFSTFAFTIIKGRILNHLKKEAVWDKRHHINSEHPGFLAEQYFDQYFRDHSIKSCSALLTKKQSKWLEQTFIHQKSLIQIANEEGVSISAVKSWRRGALRKLKESSMPECWL